MQLVYIKDQKMCYTYTLSSCRLYISSTVATSDTQIVTCWKTQLAIYVQLT